MNLIAETTLASSGAPAIAYEYVWFNGHPVAQVDAGGATHWTFTDHLGTPILLTNSDGSTYWRAEYEPFGAVYALRSADVHQPLRLPGQEAEQLDLGANGVTEREYNINRWYRGAWGRYTQADPIGLEGGDNVFIYADDSPVMQIDPYGLDSVGCDSLPSGYSKDNCFLYCCAVHDECYDKNHCSSGSWDKPGMRPKTGCDCGAGCKGCNDRVKGCFEGCEVTPGFLKPTTPVYYCGALHKYINIPSKAFPDFASAKTKCERDYSKDCKTPMPKKPAPKGKGKKGHP
jgi:RHS repeat-associated protein